MSGRFPWLKVTISTIGLMGTGWLLMKATVPTEEELYNRMAPDLQRKVDASRAARLARENFTKPQTTTQLNDPDNAKPVWADPPPTR